MRLRVDAIRQGQSLISPSERTVISVTLVRIDATQDFVRGASILFRKYFGVTMRVGGAEIATECVPFLTCFYNTCWILER
jgi:hypothetical protein